jgi:hypothetical protein
MLGESKLPAAKQSSTFLKKTPKMPAFIGFIECISIYSLLKGGITLAAGTPLKFLSVFKVPGPWLVRLNISILG